MIKYGIQDNQHPVKRYDKSTDSTSVTLEPIKEKYLRLSAPWKRKIFSITTDQIERYRPTIGFYWHKHSNARAWFIRVGIN